MEALRGRHQRRDRNRVSATRYTVLALSLAGVVGGRVATQRGHHDDWLRVASDSSYDIAIDTGRFGGDEWRGYRIRSRTTHATPHYHNGVTFDREVVQSVVACHSMTFRVASVDLSLGDGTPVVRQRTSAGELGNQPWRPIERGTLDDVAAQAACNLARRRLQQR
jgi:hypothetical protein